MHHTREITVVVEGQDAEALQGLHAMAESVQVVQASVNGTPVNFEDLPNPEGSRFATQEELPPWPRSMDPAEYLRRWPHAELAPLAQRYVDLTADEVN